MEFLQGRALTNAIGNLNVQDAYADALHKFGLKLEEITEQVTKKFATFLWNIFFSGAFIMKSAQSV